MKGRLRVPYLLEVKSRLWLERTLGPEKNREGFIKPHNQIMPEAGLDVVLSNVLVQFSML